MDVDWITVSAQIVNFLILVWLLRRFLYRPVVRAMDRREERIASRLNEADEREREADERVQRYESKCADLEQRQDEILKEAKREADQRRHELLEEARSELSQTRAAWREQADRERDEFLSNLRRRAFDSVESIARRVLRDLAGSDLEEQIIVRFLDQLKHLDDDSRRMLQADGQKVKIASTFELESSMRSRLTRAVHEHIAEGADVSYARSDDLMCGIELSTRGQRLSWNVDAYLEQIERRIDDALVQTEPAERSPAHAQ